MGVTMNITSDCGNGHHDIGGHDSSVIRSVTSHGNNNEKVSFTYMI